MLFSQLLEYTKQVCTSLGRPSSLALGTISTAVLVLLAWRLWAFTIKPLTRRDAPKELPYWLPYFGHAFEFIGNGQGLLTRARLYFRNTREPFALTLGGEKLYFLTAPEDVQAFFRNTSSLEFESVVYDLGITFGVSKEAMDLSYVKPISEADDRVSQALGTRNSRLKCLVDLNKEFWKMQLHPGDEYRKIQDAFLEEITEKLKHDQLPTSSVRSSSAAELTVSLLTLCQRVLIESTLNAFFGKVLLRIEPSLVQDFLDFDEENWKLWYKWPKATKMNAAKDKMAKAIEHYLALGDETREDASFIIKTFIKSQRALDTSDADIAKVLCMLVFVMNTNTPKTCFWAVAHLLQDRAFYQQVLDGIDSVFTSSGIIDLQALADSSSLSSLVNEVLRLGSASSSMRVTTSDTIIGGKRIPAKSRVMVPTRELHLNPIVFGSTSNQFRAARFMASKEDLTKNSSFRPFGGGISHCPGRFIAQQEIKMVVVLLLKHWNIEIAGNGQIPELETKVPTTGIMGPREGGDVLLRMRPIVKT
ncbi:cytochrome P450 [Paraphoma chrysanthemicola]|uniref:Cytochrome P450 n=1 Tax=Paraphoma chrysanthemicola TaxID=798071 RepID=A0A8K0RB42_9PLEO|nr:cytochrome P450 [Paraphoma chrysanthemicola]